MATEAAETLRFDAIVLAAGFGARFGGGKLSRSWRGGRLIDGALRSALAAPARTVIVVTGADAAVAEAVAAFDAPLERIKLVQADDYALGMSASLRVGIAALPEDCDGAFVFLGDMPLIASEVLPRLADAVAAGAQAAAPMLESRRGHPVLLARSLFPALMRLSGDEGAREVLRGLGDALALIATRDRGVLIDVDAPSDLDSLG